MDDIPTHLHPLPALVTIGDLDPVHGQHVEMDYTGRIVAERYRILQRIGSGGMADVYRAQDERLRCAVAVKFLKPRLASEEWCARMFQEARASAAIDHPHLLRVTDVGRIGPSIYLAMDLLQGASFAAVLRGQPGQRLPWRRVLELMLPVAGAFQAAHDRGFIHRDIKPDNLYLHRSGDEERIVVLDLGIVKRTAAAGSLGVGLRPTATGYLLGTPAYMSPEQAAGDPIDARTDIYSFGVTLYRALTGSLPFPPNGDAFVVLTRHIYEAPPEFAAHGLDAADCPVEVEQIVMRTLAKRPDERFASMRALAVAMRAALGGGDTSRSRLTLLPAGDGDTVTGANPKTPRRSVRLRGFGGLSVAASLVGTLATWPAWPRETAAEFFDEPGIAAELSRREIPEGPPVPAAALSEAPATAPTQGQASAPAQATLPAHAPRAQLRRYAAAVAACQREAGDADARSLKVELEVTRAGRVSRVRTGGDASSLDLCVLGVFRSLRLSPALAGTVRHTFRFTAEGAT